MPASTSGSAAWPPPAGPRASLASLRARPKPPSSGPQFGRPPQNLTVAAVKASWTNPDTLAKAQQNGDARPEAARPDFVPPNIEHAGGMEDANGASILAEARPASLGHATKKAKTETNKALHAGDGVPPQKQTACALLARMHELHAASAPKHGHDCAFASALGPFASGMILDDADVPDAPDANENKNEGDAPEALCVEPGAGPPPLPRLAQALLALDACFHRSCKTHGFVASYCQWRSEVRCAPPAGPSTPSCSIAPMPPPARASCGHRAAYSPHAAAAPSGKGLASSQARTRAVGALCPPTNVPPPQYTRISPCSHTHTHLRCPAPRSRRRWRPSARGSAPP